MPFDFPIKPTVGEPGVGGINWGALLNSLLDAVETAINSNLANIDSHDHDDRYFTETEITTWRNAVTQAEMGFLHGVTDSIQQQLNGKAAGVHGHQSDAILTPFSGTPDLAEILASISGSTAAIPISLSTLKNWYDVMNPNVSGVTVQPYISNRFGGIRINCSASSAIFVRSWEIILKRNDVIIYQASSSHSSFFVDEGEGFSNGDSLFVQTKLYTGIDSIVVSDIYQFTYDAQVNPTIAAIQSQLEGLTFENIIDTLVQDDAAMTAFANRLQSSNLLANKIASILAS